ncbi:MAG: nitrite reductase small subunit NirD [Gammaproteobacteria bacterium]|nr:MAG: nitrite reductase small subunit NirD [Gammaproteobacteria bacterium]
MSTAENRVSDSAQVICQREDLIPNSGICALVNGQQVAVFYLPEETPQVYAIGNWDPIGKANVLSRGIVGDVQGRIVVASPLYKQHFDLVTGECLENEDTPVPVFSVELVDEQVILSE